MIPTDVENAVTSVRQIFMLLHVVGGEVTTIFAQLRFASGKSKNVRSMFLINQDKL